MKSMEFSGTAQAVGVTRLLRGRPRPARTGHARNLMLFFVGGRGRSTDSRTPRVLFSPRFSTRGCGGRDESPHPAWDFVVHIFLSARETSFFRSTQSIFQELGLMLGWVIVFLCPPSVHCDGLLEGGEDLAAVDSVDLIRRALPILPGRTDNSSSV